MPRQPRPAVKVEQTGMGVSEKIQRHTDGDVGMAEIGAKPPVSGAVAAIGLKRIEDAADLTDAALNPHRRGAVMDGAFIDQRDRLIGQTDGESADF